LKTRFRWNYDSLAVDIDATSLDRLTTRADGEAILGGW
jgi:hypothetical protein